MKKKKWQYDRSMVEYYLIIIKMIKNIFILILNKQKKNEEFRFTYTQTHRKSKHYLYHAKCRLLLLYKFSKKNPNLFFTREEFWMSI